MIRKASLFLFSAAAGLALTLLVVHPRLLHVDMSALAASSTQTAAETYKQLELFGDVFERVRADAQQSILGLQQYFDTLWNVVRAQRRHPDPKIYGKTVLQFARDASRNDLAFRQLTHGVPRFLTVRFSMRFS